MTDEKRCGTCKHWGVAEEDEEDERRFAQSWADDMKAKHNYTYCGRIMHTNEVGDIPGGLEGYPDELVGVEDAENYNAHLISRPGFGCVLWEPKP